jgi:hypothetical protein
MLGTMKALLRIQRFTIIGLAGLSVIGLVVGLFSSDSIVEYVFMVSPFVCVLVSAAAYLLGTTWYRYFIGLLCGAFTLVWSFLLFHQHEADRQYSFWIRWMLFTGAGASVTIVVVAPLKKSDDRPA